MTERCKLYIGGKWIDSSGNDVFKNVNPADTSDVVSEHYNATQEEALMAIEAAEEASKIWGRTLPSKRGEVLMRASQILKDRADELGRLLTREEGKTFKEGRGEVLRAAAIMEYFGGEGYRLLGNTIPSTREKVFSFTLKKPLGVVAIITPWNFPIAIPAWKIAPALISGNALVFKPASLAPLLAVKLVEVLEEAGLPAGVINLVTGRGSVVGDTIVKSKKVRAISFTGSTETGRSISEKASPNFTRLQLEMGGKNPTIVLNDADLEAAVSVIIEGAYMSAGEKCTATSRVIVTEKIADKLVELLVERTEALKIGNGLRDDVDVGPVIDEAQMNSILSYIEKGKSEGARLLTGGYRILDGECANGYYIKPTVFDHVSPDMTIAQEEIFGPVVAVIRVKDVEEAIEVANGVKYGLSASLCSKDLYSVFKYVSDIEAGVINVNLPSAGVELQCPFGGCKESSYGMREQGHVAIDFYTESVTVYINWGIK